MSRLKNALTTVAEPRRATEAAQLRAGANIYGAGATTVDGTDAGVWDVTAWDYCGWPEPGWGVWDGGTWDADLWADGIPSATGRWDNDFWGRAEWAD